MAAARDCAIVFMCPRHCLASASSAQMLVLTYEAAGVDRLVPYFNHRFAPLKPIQIYGRYAKGEPACKPMHAVWYAWKDFTGSQQHSALHTQSCQPVFYASQVRFQIM